MSYIQVKTDDVLESIVGIYKDWSQTTPVWTYCDCDGTAKTPVNGWQTTHPILKNIKTCTVTAAGQPTYGSNPRGDGLTLDGSTGQVMVRIPAIYADRWWEGDFEFFVPSRSPVVTPGGRSLTLHPAFYQRGGWPRSQLFVGRYYSGLACKAAGTCYALSATGKQPWSGEEMVEIAFTGGSAEPVAGDVLIGAISGVRGTVVAWYVATGDWGTSDAAGKIYLKLVDERLNFNTGSVAFTPGQTVTGASSTATGIIDQVVVSTGSWGGGDAAGYLAIRGGNAKTFTISPSEVLTGSGGGAAKATSDATIKAPFTNPENLQRASITIMVSGGVGTILPLTCQQHSDYAKAFAGTDTRWGGIGPFTNDLVSLLAYLDLGTCDIQALASVGAGVTAKLATRNFGGANNGADSIDSNVDIWGTGKGTGSAGQTPSMWRGIQDIQGNLYGFVIGIQGNIDGVWDIINPTGQFIPTSPLTAGSFVSTIGSCLGSDGYWGHSMREAAAKWLLLPEDVSGSSVTKRCDYYYYPRYATTVLRVGGAWNVGARAGVGYRSAYGAASDSGRSIGGRLEFLP